MNARSIVLDTFRRPLALPRAQFAYLDRILGGIILEFPNPELSHDLFSYLCSADLGQHQPKDWIYSYCLTILHLPWSLQGNDDR